MHIFLIKKLETGELVRTRKNKTGIYLTLRDAKDGLKGYLKFKNFKVKDKALQLKAEGYVILEHDLVEKARHKL